MHELSLAEDVLRKIKEAAQERRLAKVAFAKVAIGQTLLSDLEELRELLSMIAVGTLAENARLDFEVVSLKGKCSSCGSDVDMKTFRLDCPHCGSSNFQIISGKELEILEIK